MDPNAMDSGAEWSPEWEEEHPNRKTKFTGRCPRCGSDKLVDYYRADMIVKQPIRYDSSGKDYFDAWEWVETLDDGGTVRIECAVCDWVHEGDLGVGDEVRY